EEAAGHFGWFALFAALDVPASSAFTRGRLGGQPKQPGLIPDLDRPRYFDASTARGLSAPLRRGAGDWGGRSPGGLVPARRLVRVRGDVRRGKPVSVAGHTGLRIFIALIREASVVGLTPSSSAAPPGPDTFQFVRRKASSKFSRSSCSSSG